MVGEGAGEDLAGQPDQLRPAAIGGAERLDAPAADGARRVVDQVGIDGRRGQGLDGRVHQRRVGAAEAVDGLLGIADPDRLSRERGQLEEDGELDGAGVLKLVHQDEIDLAGQLGADLLAPEQLQRERLLVDEVDHAALALVLLISGEPVGGDAEEEPDHPVHVRAQSRVLDMAAGRSANAGGVNHRLLRRHVSGEFCPVSPPESAAPQVAQAGPQQLDVARGPDGRVGAALDGARRRHQSSRERAVGIAGRCARAQAGIEIPHRALRAREELSGQDSVGASGLDDAADLEAPVELPVEAIGEHLELVGGFRAHHLRECAAKLELRHGVVEDAHRRRHA